MDTALTGAFDGGLLDGLLDGLLLDYHFHDYEVDQQLSFPT